MAMTQPTGAGPIDAVLFDFHGTVAQVEAPLEWVTKAAATCGVTVDPEEATALAKALLEAGRAGGPLPSGVPEHLAEAWRLRDLDRAHNRVAYTGLAATVPSAIPGLAEALYDRLLIVDGWRAYADTRQVLRTLRDNGVGTALVSNIGFDLRPLTAHLGFGDLIDVFTLSYEVGYCKPDREIFAAACRSLGVRPERALMVGDTPADAGAVSLGCRCLILPCSGPEATHGLRAVLDVAGVTP